jgi:heme-degrading monooxygenase HmoA
MSNESAFARTPEPPYYAVIFTSLRSDGENGYRRMAERMVELAAMQPGFLGIESVRDADGFGITVSYWTSTDAIARWKANAEHLAAQEMGTRTWYAHYELRVAKVERAYARPSA